MGARRRKTRCERLAIEQFAEQYFERCDVIHVVPGRQHMHGKMQFGGALQRLLGHALRAPGNVLEQARMPRLHAKEVIAPVEGGPEDGALAWLPKQLGSLHQKGCWQRRTVGIDNYRSTMAAREELRDRMIEAVPEGGIRRLDQNDFARQILFKETPRVRGTVRNVAGDRGLSRGCEDVVRDIAQKSRIALRGLVEGQRRDQSGLGASGDRSLGHHGDAAGWDHGILVSTAPRGTSSRAPPDANRCSLVIAEQEKAIPGPWLALPRKSSEVQRRSAHMVVNAGSCSYFRCLARSGHRAWARKKCTHQILLAPQARHDLGRRVVMGRTAMGPDKVISRKTRFIRRHLSN